MTNDKLLAALNNQINAELYSAYLYQSMSAYFVSQNLLGFAGWMQVQAKEEWQHAMKFYNFIHDRRWKVTLTQIDAPETDWGSPLAAFEAAFAHEQKVTAMINNLVQLAVEAKDYPTSSFLQWFIDEQVEEEANADSNVQKLLMAGDNKVALLMIDAELGKRTAE